MKQTSVTRRIISVLALSLALLLPLTACDKGGDGPRREAGGERPNGGKEDPPGGDNTGGERPDPSDGSIDFATELRDDTPRFEGSGVSMRFDRGGILLKELSDSRHQIIDIDGAGSVEATLGVLLPDSTLPAATIILDGQKLTGLAVKMKKQTAGAVWYHVQAAGSKSGYMLVLP